MHIQDMADDLIRKHYYDMLLGLLEKEELLMYVRQSLKAGDVRYMEPEELGRILCSFKRDDIRLSQDEMRQHLQFSGDCEGMLRGLVATCLAYAIRDRLCPPAPPEESVPAPYSSAQHG